MLDNARVLPDYTVLVNVQTNELVEETARVQGARRNFYHWAYIDTNSSTVHGINEPDPLIIIR